MSSDKIETIETNFNNEGEIIVTQVDHLAEGQKSQDKSEPEKNTSVRESPVKSDNSAGSGNQRVKAPLASEEALELEMEMVSSDASSDNQLLNEIDLRNGNSESNKMPGLITLSSSKIFPERDRKSSKGNHQNNGNGGVNTQEEDVAEILRNRDSDDPKHGAVYNFFRREKQAFIKESHKKLRLIPKKNTRIDFGEIVSEFKGEGKDSPRNHWKNQAKKREGEKCPELLSTVIMGLFFTLAPNCAIVLDYMAAQEYLGGNWYLKYSADLKGKSSMDVVCLNRTEAGLDTICRPSTGGFLGLEYLKDGYCECLEYDPVWGALTLVFTFTSGVFWSFLLFFRLYHYLTERDRAFYNRKRMVIFFFIPLAIISVGTFPLQLVIISLINVFNDQEQWSFLTIKIGVAEGLFNAHFQFILQLFVFCVRADRHPSFWQFFLLFGSLAFLSYSRVESLLLDRGGPRMSPGQRLWWILRFGPSFLLNCAFKLGSIGLILAMLRFNAIWLYGFVILIWILFQILFNEQVISRRHYYLFLGAGMHAITVAHIPEYVKLIDTDPDMKKNVLWSTKLSSGQLRTNLRLQNLFWFLFNTIIISCVWIAAEYMDQKTEFYVFWPFTPNDTYRLEDNKVFKVIQYVAPIIIIIGTISQIIIWFFEERPIKIKDVVKMNLHPFSQQNSTSTERDTVDSAEPGETPLTYEGWTHVSTLTYDDKSKWHKHTYDMNLTRGVQGKFNQIIYPLLNVWENFGDRNIQT